MPESEEGRPLAPPLMALRGMQRQAATGGLGGGALNTPPPNPWSRGRAGRGLSRKHCIAPQGRWLERGSKASASLGPLP